MSGPIFGNSSSLNSSNNLVEFRAGRMNLVGKMVHPDQRKGLVYLYQSDDQLIHFCWKDRTTGNVEDDLIVFSDDCEFKRVEACKTGRVFLLRFKSSERKLFFWMQEPKTDKDEEWCRRINEYINHPPTGNSSSSRGNSGGENNDLQYMLNNMSQQQLMQLFGGVGQMGGLSSLLGQMNRGSSSSVSPSSRNTGSRTATSSTPSASAGSTATTASTPTTATATPATPAAPKAAKKSSTSTSGGDSRVLLADLQNYLAGINTTGSSAAAGSHRNVDLSTSINSESINTILQDPQNVDALVAHLPEIDADEDKKQQLKDTLSSPQFQQALSTFSSALQSGQLGPVVSQFKLSSEAVAAAVSGDLEQFVKALERTVTKAAPSSEGKQESEEAKDDDDPMTLG